MPARQITRLLVHTIRQHTSQFGTRSLYFTFVIVEYDDGSESRASYPIDVPADDHEAHSSYNCHERIVQMARTGELFPP
jgi:hypothetical protein